MLFLFGLNLQCGYFLTVKIPALCRLYTACIHEAKVKHKCK